MRLLIRLIRWWYRVRKSAVPWSSFGVVEDPDGVFYDYRCRIWQKERTLARVNRLQQVNALRRMRVAP